MAKAFHTLLADSLRVAKKVANKHIIQSAALPRSDRERLLRAGSLQRIIRGWYLLCQPHTDAGETTTWYANYWDFVQQYLDHRFGNNYCLSSQTSMDLYLGKNYIPQQIVVSVNQGGNSLVQLPHATSLLIYQDNENIPQEKKRKKNLNVLPFEEALCKMPPHFYKQHPEEAEIALRLLKTPEKILRFLLRENKPHAGGRIIAALKHIGNHDLATSISRALQSAGLLVTEKNPFEQEPLSHNLMLLSSSPYGSRINALWASTREAIIKLFPQPNENAKNMLKHVDRIYAQDAYHSLSIEGYQVSEKLIERIAEGSWKPDVRDEDRSQRDAMAAKGYLEAFKQVRQTIARMLNSKNPIEVLQKEYTDWYLALFSPSVTAGILSAESLAGFRNHPVYIRHARHVPPPDTAVRDCMESLFHCLRHETHPAAKAVLSHWLIGFIHPYMDGNGRMARFFMNALLVSHGYPWTIIKVKERTRYLNALEKASVDGDILPFAQMILDAAFPTHPN